MWKNCEPVKSETGAGQHGFFYCNVILLSYNHARLVFSIRTVSSGSSFLPVDSAGTNQNSLNSPFPLRQVIKVGGVEGGVGGGGGQEIPASRLPYRAISAPAPLFGLLSLAIFRLQNIKHCCVIPPVSSAFRSFSPFVPLPPLLSQAPTPCPPPLLGA